MSDPFADMDRHLLDRIGDDLTYQPGGGAAVAPPFRAHIAYTDLNVGFDNLTANVEEPTIQVRKLDVRLPTKADIITLPKNGLSYNPKSWLEKPDGDFWIIALKRRS